MDIYSIFTLIGGLAFFLYGMMIMSQGLASGVQVFAPKMAI